MEIVTLIVKKYLESKRMRTLNYRGSLLDTAIHIDDLHGWGQNVGDILYVTVVPFAACMKSIRVSFGGNTDSLAYRIGIAGIDSEDNIIPIKDNLMRARAQQSTAGDIREVLDSGWWNQCIYQKLFATIPNSSPTKNRPIEAFEPFVNDHYGVLYFKTTATNRTDLENISVNIRWVEASLSEMPLNKAYVRVLSDEQ